MFKKAKRKIVLSILAILGAVLVGTLAMIYLSSYLSVTAKNFEVLEKRADMLPMVGKEMRQPEGQGQGHQEAGRQEGNLPDQGRMERRLELETFYAVVLHADGGAGIIERGPDGVYTEEELIGFAYGIGDRTKGKIGDLLYVVREAAGDLTGDRIVCFMDNTVFTDSFGRIFLFTLIFGILAMGIIAFISAKLADRIVSPMEETYQKQKEFTADAGHELKTPIAAVAANVELLKREVGENQWLDNISHENERMRELVTDLLELARNENRSLEKEVTDLGQVVNGAILPLEAAAFEKNILIESNIGEGIKAFANGKSIGQLVTILLDNAIAHTSADTKAVARIRVDLTASKGTVLLQVANPGEPIPEAEKEKIFERFYRSDSAHEYTGHYGLGLAIAKAIADANDGKLSLDCRGGEVIFTLSLAGK